MDQNKRFHTLAGLCLHEWIPCPYTSSEWQCKECKQFFEAPLPSMPDYKADPREVLKVMREREDYRAFLRAKIDGLGFTDQWDKNILIDLILDTTGKLRDAAIKWMEGQPK